MKKIISLFLIIIIILSLFSCSKNSANISSNIKVSSNQTNANLPFVLACISGEQLHPILAKSNTNKQLLKLCYDGLIRLSNSFEAENIIANKVTQNGNSFTFEIKSNALFWDGSPITAEDIAYSFLIAKDSVSSYYTKFKYIYSFSAQENTFTVNTNSTAKRNINLFDIPIIKKNSDLNGNIPIGSGRYVLSNDKGQYSLKANDKWIMGLLPKISNIKITEIPDMNTLFHTFNSGSIGAVYADLNSSTAAYYGNIELKEFTTNIISFLGVNYSKDYLLDKRIRRGLSLAINRTLLTSEILLSHSEPIWHPFNPKWKEILSTELPKDKYSKEEAIILFEEAGFAKDNNGKRAIFGKPVTLNIVVNSDNRFRLDATNRIADNFKKLDINVTVTALSSNEYNNALNAKDFDLFFGEVKIPDNMDISVLGEPLVNKGGWDYNVLTKIINDFDSGATGIDEAIFAFEDETPFIPLYYNNSALAISRNVIGNILPVQNDIFGGIETWSLSNN